MKVDIKPKNYFTLSFVNPVVRMMTLSDFLFVSGFGLMAPIFAIFVTGQVSGGTIAVAGMAQAVFLLAKSLFQIPSAIIIDSIKGERDDYWAIIGAQIIASLTPLAYLLVSTPAHLYLVQFIYGLSFAVMQPAWNAIWMRHIDHGHEGLESGIYFTLIGIGGAMAAFLGGFIASTYGFKTLFIAVSVVSFLGTFILGFVYKNMKQARNSKK